MFSTLRQKKNELYISFSMFIIIYYNPILLTIVISFVIDDDK